MDLRSGHLRGRRSPPPSPDRSSKSFRFTPAFGLSTERLHRRPSPPLASFLNADHYDERRTPCLTFATVALTGRLTRDPEVISDGKGSRFGVAINRSFRRQGSDEWSEETTFVTCTAWNGLAKRVASKLAKGSFVAVQGRLELNQWHQDGQRRQQLRVVALEVHQPGLLQEGRGERTSAASRRRPQRDDPYQRTRRPARTWSLPGLEGSRSDSKLRLAKQIGGVSVEGAPPAVDTEGTPPTTTTEDSTDYWDPCWYVQGAMWTEWGTWPWNQLVYEDRYWCARWIGGPQTYRSSHVHLSSQGCDLPQRLRLPS